MQERGHPDEALGYDNGRQRQEMGRDATEVVSHVLNPIESVKGTGMQKCSNVVLIALAKKKGTGCDKGFERRLTTTEERKDMEKQKRNCKGLWGQKGKSQARHVRQRGKKTVIDNGLS